MGVAGEGHCSTGVITDCPTATPTPSWANRTPRRRQRFQQFETHPRQHVENDADRQNKLRCDAEECTDEDLAREHRGEPSAVGHEAPEQRRKLARVRVPIDDYSAWMRLGSNGVMG